MIKPTFYAAAMIVLSAAAFLPAVASAEVGLSIVVRDAPPPARFESIPVARRGQVWAPGYWNWDGRRHVWLAGHWESERRGEQYRHAEWRQERDGWRLQPAGWIAVGGPGYDYVNVAPPPPRYEVVPRPRPGYNWAPGSWEWRHGRHEWRGGSWIAVRPGYVYNQPQWREREGRWYRDEARWERHGHGGGDRDHDGVPNRYDRDRDGDGVPNRHDRQPDNPRRD